MSITAPKGFSAAATSAGIKASGKPDMALVVNNGPEFNAAAVFTSNRVCAAPVSLSRRVAEGGQVRAVVYNSGNANSCTGARGMADAKAMQEAAAQELGCEAGLVGVCSTGIIGEYLPMDNITAGISVMADNLGDYGHDAATAIMTTDTVSKEILIQRDGWSVAAMGKGVGMMAPSLATMLVCVTTDASVPPQVLAKALEAASGKSFNRVDIDGSTSTNDTVFLLASGASGITPKEGEFYQAVEEACVDIAKKMQADAEGATKKITITVTGTDSDAEALAAARAVGRDNLFKCAMFGSDPNWGRVLAAVGTAPAAMDPEKISVSFNGVTVCRDTSAVEGGKNVDLTGENIEVSIDLGTGGPGNASVYTTDLSHAYVEFNSAYTT